jgi:hypothetical protein
VQHSLAVVALFETRASKQAAVGGEFRRLLLGGTGSGADRSFTLFTVCGEAMLEGRRVSDFGYEWLGIGIDRFAKAPSV